MTTVLILSLSPLRRDPRVLRQISMLRSHYDVHTAGYGEAPDGVVGHTAIPESLRAWRSNYRHFYALSAARLFKRLYFEAPWVKFLREAISMGSFDIILANDANAAPLAHALEPRLGWHVDLHEYAPKQGDDNPTWRRFTKPVNTWMVRQYVTRADSATTVSRGLADAYQNEFGIDCDVVPNSAPYRSDLAPHETPVDGPIRLVYAGATARSRRLERMIDAVTSVEADAPGSVTFDLFVMPGDVEYMKMLRDRAEASSGAVTLREPVAFDALVTELAAFDLGFYACPPTNFNQERALPNKLFEFIQARLGIVIGPSQDMADYVLRYSLGVVSGGFEVSELADAVRGLHHADVDRFKAAAHAAAHSLGSEQTSSPWVDAIERIAHKARP